MPDREEESSDRQAHEEVADWADLLWGEVVRAYSQGHRSRDAAVPLKYCCSRGLSYKALAESWLMGAPSRMACFGRGKTAERAPPTGSDTFGWWMLVGGHYSFL